MYCSNDNGIFALLGWVDVTPEERKLIVREYKKTTGVDIEVYDDIKYRRADCELVCCVGICIPIHDLIDGMTKYSGQKNVMDSIEGLIHKKMMRSPQLHTHLAVHLLYDEFMD